MIEILDAFAEAPFEHIQHNVLDRLFLKGIKLVQSVVF